jgi:hypothetical protein
MCIVCEKRDRIWKAYVEALEAYSRAITTVGHVKYAEPGSLARETRHDATGRVVRY